MKAPLRFGTVATPDGTALLDPDSAQWIPGFSGQQRTAGTFREPDHGAPMAFADVRTPETCARRLRRQHRDCEGLAPFIPDEAAA